MLRRFGDVSLAEGRWAAFGGSLLWDALKREPAALRIGLCAQPAPSQQVCASFDNVGDLRASFKGSVTDAVSLTLSGRLDVNRARGSSVGLELAYDLE